MNGFTLWHAQPGQALGIASDRRVLRAAEVPPLLQAQALVDALQTLHATARAQADAACDAARAEGLRQGLAEAQARMQAQLDETLVAMTQAHEDARTRLQQSLATLALDVFAKLLGALPPGDWMARLAQQAARDLLPARTWRLVVHPTQVDGLRERLRALDGGDSAGLAAVEIVGEPDMAATGCRLLTEFGSADAGLDTQLARLAAAWGTPS